MVGGGGSAIGVAGGIGMGNNGARRANENDILQSLHSQLLLVIGKDKDTGVPVFTATLEK